MNILLLGSKSASRQMLLKQMNIPFVLIDQNADETICDWTLPFEQVVSSIARYKMKQVIMPAIDKQELFVLTADTLSQTLDGTISGKPTCREDAIAKLKAARKGMRTGTTFCLEKRIYTFEQWQTIDRIEQFVDAHYKFVVPDNWIDRYLENSSSFASSGAIAIEEYGSQFLESVDGSYTTIIGLPLYELRLALEKIGFFN